jgi:hypothetical protein
METKRESRLLKIPPDGSKKNINKYALVGSTVATNAGKRKKGTPSQIST